MKVGIWLRIRMIGRMLGIDYDLDGIFVRVDEIDNFRIDYHSGIISY